MDFYRDVLLELVTALGAALFFGNLLALARRRLDRRAAAAERAVRSRPGSPVRRDLRRATTGNLDAAPLARTITFLVLGGIVMVWGLASIVS